MMTEQESHRNACEKKRMWLASIPALLFVSFLWLIFIVGHTVFQELNLTRLGIVPGEAAGLRGILFSPLLHSSFSHLGSNTLPLFILIWFLFYFYRQIALQVFAVLWLVSGTVTWLIGREALHVGASGLVFAMLFFLFFSGIIRKYIPLVAVSLIVAFLYGGTIWSIFPVTELVDASISWEGHLSGAVSGLMVAFIFMNQGPQQPPPAWEEDNPADEEEDTSGSAHV